MSSRPDVPRPVERAVRLCAGLGFWLPLALCTWLALTPHPPDPVTRVSDVVLHAFAFSYLTFALAFLRSGAHEPRADERWTRALSLVLWMLAYGVFIEVLQSFEVERSAELKDLLVDAAGILIGLMLWRGFGAWSRRTLVLMLARLLPSRE